jgi:hypothetical protein
MASRVATAAALLNLRRSILPILRWQSGRPAGDVIRKELPYACSRVLAVLVLSAVWLPGRRCGCLDLPSPGSD